jgi:ABC-type uncharacterized transport system substrate-binding protein
MPQRAYVESGRERQQALGRSFTLSSTRIGLGCDGRNIQLTTLWSSGDAARLRSVVDEIVSLAPEVVVGGSTQVTTALKEKTRTIPIVFVHVADPLAAALVQSLARPGRSRCAGG